LVMLFDNEAYSRGFFLIRKGETPLTTDPIYVGDYLYLDVWGTLRADSIKEVKQYNADHSLKSSSVSKTFSEKGQINLNIQDSSASGMLTLNWKFDVERNYYVVSPSKILSIAGENRSSENTIEGRIEISASKAADISMFVD
jgi:hypothetical protein